MTSLRSDEEDDLEEEQETLRGDRYSFAVGYNSKDAASDGKYYFNSDRIQETHVSNYKEVDSLYAKTKRPTIQNLVESCMQDGFSLEGESPLDFKARNKVVWNIELKQYQSNWFQQGDWVEYRGNDMFWKLGLIRRVVFQAPDDWDYEENDGLEPPVWMMTVLYAFKEQGLVEERFVRAPKSGLERIFGSGPFLWQQHCLLQLERRLRFQEGHEYDFEQVDNQRFANQRFNDWLNAPGNEKFRNHFNRQPEIAQRLLKGHLLTPFELMDQITENSEEWDFRDKDVSVYMYTSILGSGCLMFIVALVIQGGGLFILLLNGIQMADDDPNPRFFFEEPEQIFYFLGLELATTNFTRMCRGTSDLTSTNIEGKVLLILITLLYLCLIVPSNTFRFYRVAGAYGSMFIEF